MRGFRDRRAAIEFCLLSVATFFCFTTSSQSALLAVVTKFHGMSLHQTGIVLSAYGVAVLVFMLIAGPLATKFGNLVTLRLGMALVLVAYASFHITITSAPAAVLSRLIQGLGYALFMPAAMAFARSKLSEERLVYLFGLYSCTVSLPNAVGPPLGEVYLHSFGDRWFFIIGAIPAVFAVLLSISLTDEASQQRGSGLALPLWRTALLPGLRQPLAAIFVVGALYGMVISYLAAILADKGVPIGFFFTTFTAVLFACRFGLMGYIAAWPRQFVLGFAIASMATAYIVIAHATAWILIAAAGVFFGAGYSIAYPMLSIAVTEQFEPHWRTTPLAILNMAFSGGILLTSWLGAYVIAGFGSAGLLYLLAASGFAVLPYLLLAGRTRRDPWLPVVNPKRY